MLPAFPGCYLQLEIYSMSLFRQCSHLETDTLNSGAIRTQMGRQLWAEVVLPGCFTAVLQPNSASCPLCHLVLASTVSRYGASFIFFPCYETILIAGILECPKLCFLVIQESANWPVGHLKAFVCFSVINSEKNFYIFKGFFFFLKESKVISQAISLQAYLPRPLRVRHTS